MANELNIPEKLLPTFNRLIRKLPEELRENEQVRKTTLLFLQLGGEKLARSRLRAFQVPFHESFVFKKMQIKNDDDVELPVPEEEDEEAEADSEDMDI